MYISHKGACKKKLAFLADTSTKGGGGPLAPIVKFLEGYPLKTWTFFPIFS